MQPSEFFIVNKAAFANLQRHTVEDLSPPNYSNENDAHATSQESARFFWEGEEDTYIENEISS